ncbi:SMP-30/gluconolactonase/LRE family protein [Pyxidicoccus xibeiensis]|uniref:SMP-30/gluconolactonase/LRE family protein n=1 Tax=Pyxidicoccus xibeiensis TaxID=2906759 RepID=UPI0020A833AE|nr:SMP-30/gluconolactonase/LRE family protein [Pyxidicoccus xibeiensis]MCP3135875.1 SMP-30/gluconolactonase/LRE family protein [Pyxidicoccus xibeiensis]
MNAPTLRSALLFLLLSAPACRTTAPTAPAAQVPAPAADPLLQGLTQLSKADPENRVLLYAVASRHAERGEGAQALQWLQKLDALQWDHAPEPKDFKAWSATPEFREVAGRIAAREAKVFASEPAFTLSERDFIPEGIAWDSETGTFFIGSIRLRKVVAVEKDGRVRDFIPEARDGLWSVLGLKVDATRRHLWVASQAAAGGKGIAEAERGRTGLFQYDLRTGALLRKVTLDGQPGAHLLNDLAISANGDVFVTDSEAGGVRVLRAGAGSLTPLVPERTLIYPNGIALSEDGARLYVAHYTGLVRVDPASGAVTRVKAPAGATLGGVDGLSAHGSSLVAVQSGIGRGRIVRFHLGGDADQVERVEVLEGSNPLFDTPTTGTVAGGHFVYIANSYVRDVGPDGALPPLERLRPPVLLRVALGK